MNFEINRIAEDAIEDTIAKSTLGITPDDGITLGTGVAIEYKKQFLIVTAKHLIEGENSNDFWFYYRNDQPLIRGTRKDIKKIRLIKGRERFKIPIINIYLSDSIDDVGIIIIDPSALNINLIFHKLNVSRRTPNIGTTVVLFGKARQLLTPMKDIYTGKQGYGAFTNCEWRKIIKPITNILGYNSRRHFLIDFSGDTTSDDFVTDPSSMSGCGVWALPYSSKGSLWNPYNVKLCGIQCGWYEKNQALKATKVERLVNLLKLHC